MCLAVASTCQNRPVGSVGRLVKEKGYLELFEAARMLRQEHADVVVVCVGPEEPGKADGLSARDLALAARAHAFVRGRGYVTPEDIKAVGPDVLRHRIILSYEAEAEEVTADEVVRRIFDAVPVP